MYTQNISRVVINRCGHSVLAKTGLPQCMIEVNKKCIFAIFYACMFSLFARLALRLLHWTSFRISTYLLGFGCLPKCYDHIALRFVYLNWAFGTGKCLSSWLGWGVSRLLVLNHLERLARDSRGLHVRRWLALQTASWRKRRIVNASLRCSL